MDKTRTEHSGDKKDLNFGFGPVECNVHVRHLGNDAVLETVYMKLVLNGSVQDWKCVVGKFQSIN